MEYGNTAVCELKRIAAGNYAVVSEKATELFRNQDSKHENIRNLDFNQFENEFYDLEGLEKLQLEYLRNNYDKLLVEQKHSAIKPKRNVDFRVKSMVYECLLSR